MNLSVRKIVITGLMGAIAIFLAVTNYGMIPVPTIAGHATIMHVPVIIGAVLEGPVVGILIGGIFGAYSWYSATIPAFKDPLVAILPRLIIGITAYYTYAALRRKPGLAYGAAGLVGTLTNTVLVLGTGVARKYFPPQLLITIIPQALVELVIAVILSVAIGLGVERTFRGGSSATSSGRRRDI